MAGEAVRGNRRRAFSLAGKLLGVLALGQAMFVLLALGLRRIEAPEWLAILIAAAITLILFAWAVERFLRPMEATLRALSDGIHSFRDRDFGVRLAETRQDELGELVHLYNEVAAILQEERAHIRQRELLLQTALDRSPVAVVVVNPLGRVLYANAEAAQMLLGGARLAGWGLGDILAGCPAELRQMLDGEDDGLFQVEGAEGPETYHLAQRRFSLGRRPHRLLLLRRMTTELARQEVEVWKKVLRIISHELNNSLAPISSLAHSARAISRETPEAARLEPLFASIRDRVEHLSRFLEGYARFARLPRPKKEIVSWDEWLAVPRRLYPFEMPVPPPRTPGWFDAAQMQQVLINLLKNAYEASEGQAGSIEVAIDRLPDRRTLVRVTDRGRGMGEEVMRQALLPFYTTKSAGTGVGLPLCREIIEAHGGTLRIESRPGGGTVVSFRLPPAPEGA